MKELNYQPNLSTKKLRASDSKKQLHMMLARFLTGLQNEKIKF